MARVRPVSRIALFGGTFDPIHVGHLAIAEAARRELGHGDVVFVPARRNPLKSEEPEVSAEDRYEMVRVALFASPGLRASRLELDRDGPSYTVDTLRHFAREHAELFLIVGADALRDLAQWREREAVLDLATLLVAKRPGTEADLDALRRRFPAARLRPLDSPLVDLSSRALRAYARTGGSLRYLVPEAAWRYAAAKRLYGQVTEGT